MRQYVPFSARTADALRDRFIGATQATLLGTGVISIAQGLLVGLGFAITGLPEPRVLGQRRRGCRDHSGDRKYDRVASGMCCFSSRNIAMVPAVTLFIFGFGLAGNVDSIVRPLVYRRLSEMHPMITFVGVLAGIRYLGVVGLLLGPLAIVYVFELLRFYREEYSSA